MMDKINLLELNLKENKWTPPKIQIDDIVISLQEAGIIKGDDYLHILKTEPYIDSIYIEHKSNGVISNIRRFTIHEDYVWNSDDEKFFHEHCIKDQRCGYSGQEIENIYRSYNEKYPEWHIKRYLTKGLKVLDHIYSCVRRNTAKEMLYKAGLDELAAHIDEIDDLNLMATKPTEIYSGLNMKVLRSLNCSDGAALINDQSGRDFIRELNLRFSDLFKERLNDAQCRYVKDLIKENLTLGEVGRLVRSRKPALARVWTKSLYEIFMLNEQIKKDKDNLLGNIATIDPVYNEYFIDNKNDNDTWKKLNYYLIQNRKEYDRRVRSSNRRREYNWQERNKDYCVRYPQTINDFCREAIYMRNCLLGYVEAMINADTTILFMRKADDINTPFITIEVYHGELMQAYHRFNEDCNSEEARWIRDYCYRHGISTEKFTFDATVDLLM